jgi:hypothetical protein
MLLCKGNSTEAYKIYMAPFYQIIERISVYQAYYLKAYSPQHSLPTLGTLKNISLACEMDLRP